MPVTNENFDDGATLLVFAHQDDDLLWMQPFQDSAAALLLAAAPPAPAHAAVVAQHPQSYRERWHSLFSGTTTDQEWFDIFGLCDRCERDKDWNYERILSAVDSWVSRPDFSRIVTHNNWGEYGHIHHRWVNRAVRELAARYGKDVWVLNTVVLFHADEAVYLDLGDWNLPAFRTRFSPNVFFDIRGIYQRTEFDARPAGLNTWTWFDGEDQYPHGERNFVKIVERGIDQTQSNPLVQKTVAALEQTVPIREACIH
ncbi:hypothetical protein [Allochromatium palmeri]|uniref:PIG-L family deacetylase n=1 Tax=Allochromatium palmeri TaxID=231048 RepID=A0A6N8E6S0_9GAMM|nr:hypothetical protein [Allochromatium palmeri]MTW19805.1 hypothetical protein [Allochromatium palmeri]